MQCGVKHARVQRTRQNRTQINLRVQESDLHALVFQQNILPLPSLLFLRL